MANPNGGRLGAGGHGARSVPTDAGLGEGYANEFWLISSVNMLYTHHSCWKSGRASESTGIRRHYA
jgi:hypothetical protein